MEKQYNTEEQPKLAWNTPEVEVLPINEITLAGAPGVVDAGFFS
ncbi:hypothetical protein [Emticicia soli]|uniref:Lasso RiPP family leader peptide-containing protein n=1 Tax=Emticicia soli TaxID=2027878 RepID=A0ABW5J8W3_9BACT